MSLSYALAALWSSSLPSSLQQQQQQQQRQRQQQTPPDLPAWRDVGKSDGVLLHVVRQLWNIEADGKPSQYSRVASLSSRGSGAVVIVVLGLVSFPIPPSSHPDVTIQRHECSDASSLNFASSAANTVNIIIMGECPATTADEASAPSSPLVSFSRIYNELDAVVMRIDKIRKAQPQAKVVCADLLTGAFASSSSSSSSPQEQHQQQQQSWERRKTSWWGWELLSGRASPKQFLRQRRGHHDASTELLQLRNHLLLRHLVVKRSVVVLFDTVPPESRLERMFQQLALSPPSEQRGELAVPSFSAAKTCTAFLLTRKRGPFDCLPAPSVAPPLLFTTLGGGGTHFVAKSLQELFGLDVLHEGLGSAGAVSWMYAVNDAALGTAYPHHAFLPPASRGMLSPRFEHVVHVTRSPMAHVSSFSAHLNTSCAFVRLVAHSLQHRSMSKESWEGGSEGGQRLLKLARALTSVPISCGGGREGRVEGGGGLVFAALAWLFWDALAGLQADARIQVEKPRELRRVVESETCQRLLTRAAAESEARDGVEEEAGLVQVVVAGLYRLVAPPSRPSSKKGREESGGGGRDRPHGKHREYSLSDVEALPLQDRRVSGVDILAELRDKIRQYGYDES